MKRLCLLLALLAMSVSPLISPAGAQTCSIGGHNETSENFAPGGWATPPGSPGTIVGAPTGSHLVFSELAPRGFGVGGASDSSEYIEIYNPTTRPVRLDDKYISDDISYYRIVNGTYLAANTSDWAMRFPVGLRLNPGRTLVLCVTKSGFAGSGASAPAAQIFLEMKDSNGNPADDMIVLTTNSSFPVTGGVMTNPSATQGEWVVLYCWNGSSDLVCDIDYASWGNNSATNPKMNKTGVAIDGPDADALPSAFNADTAPAGQTNLGAGTTLTKPNTYQRIGGEVGEIPLGGNGCVGRVNPTLIAWVPVAGTPNIRFQVRWTNPDEDSPSTAINGSMASQEFGVFLPDFGPIGSFNVPPLQPNSFFDVFFEVPLSTLPPPPQKLLPGGGPNGPAVAELTTIGGSGTGTNCPPDTNWAGNVDIFWTGSGQGGQVNKHYADLLTCAGGPPSYIHFRGSNCTAPMPWSVVGVCPGFAVTLVNEDFSPAPNPVPVGWTGWICVSAAAAVPAGTSCCFGVVFQCNGATSTIDICSTACDWQPHTPTLTTVDWTSIGPIVRFHQRWQNTNATAITEPVTGNMSSQPFGVFLPNAGPIGSFAVPPLQPNSFFDVFFDVPLSQLPPEPPTELPGGGPPPGSPCPPPTTWHGNVDIVWTGASGSTGTVNKHFGELLVCPGADPSYIHFFSNCVSPLGLQWSISGLCPGFNATLVNEDKSPAPNPLPPGWTGWICVGAPTTTPVGVTCCFKVNFLCDGIPAAIDMCVSTCNWQPLSPTLTAVDWTNIGTTVRFHQRWENQNAAGMTAPVTGDMSSQKFGVFLPNAGPIGSFNVPPLAPSSFFDVFFDVPLSQLPPEPATQLPGGGPGPNSPCPPPTAWHGNVDVNWGGPGGTGNVNKHFGELPICPGAGPSYIHVETDCQSPIGLPWVISGLCPGFNATLVNQDFSPAPNPLPPNWVGWICVAAPATTPVGTTCCFKVNFLCNGVTATIDMCVNTCDWRRHPPTLAVVDWTNIGTTVRFRQRWENGSLSAPTEPVSGDMSSQPFGVFLPNFGPIGHFDVPSIPPSSFFDVFFDVPLSQLPPEPETRLPGGDPPPGSPCLPPQTWQGNVDIAWTGNGITGQVNRHFTDLLVCPGPNPSYVHFFSDCMSTTGMQWSVRDLCQGFGATLVNEDFTPAPNPLPTGWTGWICASAPVTTPIGATCCFNVDFRCGNATATIEVCARTCNWGTSGVPSLPPGMQFGIYQTTPNPTRQGMAVGYVLPRSGHVRLDVYNVSGQHVRSLYDGSAEAGPNAVQWDGRGESGRDLAPGTYFVTLKAADGQVSSRKVVLFH